MAKEPKSKTNNLESDKGYKVTFGYFNEDEKGEMDFPPKNAKVYDGLLEMLNNKEEMVIKVNHHDVIRGDNGQILAREEDGKILTGKRPKETKEKEVK